MGARIHFLFVTSSNLFHHGKSLSLENGSQKMGKKKKKKKKKKFGKMRLSRASSECITLAMPSQQKVSN